MLTDRQMDEQTDTCNYNYLKYIDSHHLQGRLFLKLFLLQVFSETKFLLKKYTSIYLYLPTIIRVNISNGCFYFLNNNEFTSQ